MGFTYELATEFNFDNITIERRYYDGVFKGYRVTPNEGYVMYDTNDETFELDPETGEEIPVTYYYTLAYLPSVYNMDNFSWAAVLRSSVNENYIYGSGDNSDHEAM